MDVPPFLKIPLELRINIYERLLVFNRNRVTDNACDHKNLRIHPAILYVNRQIHLEAQDVLYNHNDLVLFQSNLVQSLGDHTGLPQMPREISNSRQNTHLPMRLDDRMNPTLYGVRFFSKNLGRNAVPRSGYKLRIKVLHFSDRHVVETAFLMPFEDIPALEEYIRFCEYETSKEIFAHIRYTEMSIDIFGNFRRPLLLKESDKLLFHNFCRLLALCDHFSFSCDHKDEPSLLQLVPYSTQVYKVSWVYDNQAYICDVLKWCLHWGLVALKEGRIQDALSKYREVYEALRSRTIWRARHGVFRTRPLPRTYFTDKAFLTGSIAAINYSKLIIKVFAEKQKEDVIVTDMLAHPNIMAIDQVASEDPNLHPLAVEADCYYAIVAAVCGMQQTASYYIDHIRMLMVVSGNTEYLPRVWKIGNFCHQFAHGDERQTAARYLLQHPELYNDQLIHEIPDIPPQKPAFINREWYILKRLGYNGRSHSDKILGTDDEITEKEKLDGLIDATMTFCRSALVIKEIVVGSIPGEGAAVLVIVQCPPAYRCLWYVKTENDLPEADWDEYWD